MRQIEANKVKRDNSNIRLHSDKLWRELRKLNKLNRKSLIPDPYTNEMMAELVHLSANPNSDFMLDVKKFIDTKLSEREAALFSIYVFGGKTNQAVIAEHLGISQTLVCNELKKIISLFKEYYYTEDTYDK